MIPKKIIQTYSHESDLAEPLIKNIQHIKELNPDWEHRFFDNSEVFKFIKSNYGTEIYNSVRKINPIYGAAISDIFRYLVIFMVGGVYLDIKSSTTRPLDENLKETDCYILTQWQNRLGEKFQGYGLHHELSRVPGGELQQWHLIASPKHPFLAAVIKKVLENIETYDPIKTGVGQYGVLRLTGPIPYTKAIIPIIQKYKCRLTSTNKIGLKYTIFDGKKDHCTIMENHYSRLNEPVVL